MNPKQLEKLAAQAGRTGTPWATFWRRHGDDVRKAEPWHSGRFHALRRRLAGILAMNTPAGPAPWEQPEEQQTLFSEAAR